MLVSRTTPLVGWLILAMGLQPGTVYGQDAAPAADDRVGQAQAIVREYIEDSKVPGVSVTVALGSDIVWSEGFGFADVENNILVVPNQTLFRVGDTAIPMTATAVGLLYEQGKLDLDAPVQKYVRSFPAKEAKITTRMLAGHLAGIRHYEGDEFFGNTHYTDVLSGLDIFKDDPLVHKPGSRYEYSCYGYNLVGAVVEGAAGTDYLSYMQQNVFDPIGMSHTVADDVTQEIEYRSAYYESKMFGMRKAPDVDNSYQYPAGGFLSTSEDLVKFGQAWLAASILTPETIELFWTPQQTMKGKNIDNGIGWMIDEDKSDRRWVWHSGESVGGSTWFGIQPESGFVIAIITNVSEEDFDDIHYDLANVFLQ